MMIPVWHPACILLVGAALLPLMKGFFRNALLLLIPLLALAETLLCALQKGLFKDLFKDVFFPLSLPLWPGISDQLDSGALLVASGLVLLVWLGLLCALHCQTRGEQGAILVQTAGALGLLYSTTLSELLLFWSLLVVPPVILIWQSDGEDAGLIGCRYLVLHGAGAITLLLGAALCSQSSDPPLVSLLDSAFRPARWLFVVGLGLGAAVLPLHSWVPASCKETAPESALFPALITSTTALSLMARLCAGFEPLLVLGTVTALYAALRALLEREISRFAAWLVLFQGGLITASLGIGTDSALHGAVVCTLGHLAASGLLFMSLAALRHCTDQQRLENLAGLKRRLPVVCCFVLLACCSLTPIPGLAAYSGQSLIVSAAFEARHSLLALLLHTAMLLALLACLRLPWTLFFDRAAGTAVQPGPVPHNMLLALLLLSVLCLLFGLMPLYCPEILPFPEIRASMTALFDPERLWQTLQGLGIGLLLFILGRKMLTSRPESRPALPGKADRLLQARQDFLRQTRRLVARLEALNQLRRQGSARLARLIVALPGRLERLLAGLAERLIRTVQTLGNLAQILNRSRLFLLLSHLALLILILRLLRKL